MEIFSVFWTRIIIVTLFVLTISRTAMAQNWMPGYNCRKKITIDKSKISGTLNLLDFPVLIALEDPDLKFLNGCTGATLNGKGLDISFASIEQPALPIHFQLDTYDGTSGKLVCWVRIAELIASMNAGVNEIYLYYGANEIHDPFSATSLTTWSEGYQKVWHMNCDISPSISRSANHNTDKDANGTPGMNISNFLPALVGSGVSLNGSTEAMSSAIDTNTRISITAWIKLSKLGIEQVIIANDSLNTGGYRIKVNSSGNLGVDIFDPVKSQTNFASAPLVLNTWYHIAIIYNNGQKKIYINGVYKGGGSSTLKLGRGGSVSIGRSKQGDCYFDGIIDELRIQNIERTAGWLTTEFVNQENPGAFFTVSAKEVNPAQTEIVNEFTAAAGTNSWTNAGNWSNGKLPENYANIRVRAGKTLRIEPGLNAVVGNLVLEPGAALSVGNNLEINCLANIGVGASIILDDGIRLIFKNDVINNGAIGSGQSAGTLVFAGNNPLQTFSGTGMSIISRLEVNQDLAGHTLLLQAPINVISQVDLIRGIINSNGNLTLLSSTQNNAASLLPVQDPVHANIIGNVKVQRFIDGPFPDPSTARGWRLLTSPVYHSITTAGVKQYDLSKIKESIFVTGAGGINNGFDPSPNNGATIYTHNQSLPGTLSQKYIAIQNMSVNVPLGNGIYVFSRGDKSVVNAYINQIQTAPFSNPQSYVITYSGLLHTGDLTVNLFNKNTGAEGDGFNLLGNPYASPITWGNLQKENVGPFIWVFDPKNNAYYVTDDPGFIINSGTGFFVRVINGNTTGILTFNESAKYTGFDALSPQSYASRQNTPGSIGGLTQSRLKVRLSRNELSEYYQVIFRAIGNDEVSDADAPKIGEGYLSIAGLTVTGSKLSIDERAMITKSKEIKLYVKGWANGSYKLSLTGLDTFDHGLGLVTLVDHYLNVHKDITELDSIYLFSIDTKISKTYGDNRFSLLFHPPGHLKITPPPVFNKDNILIYPNPFNDVIYLKTENPIVKNLKILIRGISGKVFSVSNAGVFEKGKQLEIPCGQLTKGIYIIQLIDTEKNQTISSYKIIKE